VFSLTSSSVTSFHLGNRAENYQKLFFSRVFPTWGVGSQSYGTFARGQFAYSLEYGQSAGHRTGGWRERMCRQQCRLSKNIDLCSCLSISFLSHLIPILTFSSWKRKNAGSWDFQAVYVCLSSFNCWISRTDFRETWYRLYFSVANQSSVVYVLFLDGNGNNGLF
jgi:hypothetical protein